MKTSTNYNKFIILGTARTGSSLLWSYLNSHSNIICLRGVFGSSKKINFGKYYEYLPDECYSKDLISLRNNNPTLFLDKYVFKDYSKQYKAIGFKYFYNHNRHLKNRNELVDYFKNNTNIKFIHIKRKNLLASLFSYKRALEQNKWIDTDINLNTKISIEESQDFFKKTIEQENYFDKIFAGRTFEVIYEDFIRDGKILQNVQDFIGVEPKQLESEINKNKGGELSDMILNFNDLKEYYKSTEYELYFE
jgi:hypothetical protein